MELFTFFVIEPTLSVKSDISSGIQWKGHLAKDCAVGVDPRVIDICIYVIKPCIRSRGYPPPSSSNPRHNVGYCHPARVIFL